MARMTSNLTELKTPEPVPEGVYTSHIEVVDVMKGKNPPYNPYLNLTHLIEGDENGGPSPYSGRKIMYDNVMTGGKNKTTNEDLTPFELAKILEVYAIPHTCTSCHPEIASEIQSGQYDGRYDRVTTFHRGTGEDGIRKGAIVCSECSQPMNVDYDTANFLGKRARIAVKIGMNLKGNPVNNVSDYVPVA